MIRKKKKKTSSDFKRSTYVDTLDSVLSHRIRQMYADETGYCPCYTCDKSLPWKEMQNGHYGRDRSTRGSHSTRWLMDAVRPQCYGCNVGQWGRQAVFHERLVEELGEKRVEAINTLKNKSVKYTNYELLEMIKEHYAALRWPEQVSVTLARKLKQLKVIDNT